MSNIKKVKPLPQNALQDRIAAQNKMDDLNQTFDARITYVLSILVEAFEAELDCWWAEGTGNDYSSEIEGLEVDWNSEELFNISYACITHPNDPCLLLDNGEVWEFSGAFPIRWLYEDCEKEIRDGRAAYLKQAKKADAKKSVLQKRRETAMAKLTQDEAELLGLL